LIAINPFFSFYLHALSAVFVLGGYPYPSIYAVAIATTLSPLLFDVFRSKLLDYFGYAASRTDQNTLSFVQPFRQCAVCEIGSFALGFALPKCARVSLLQVLRFVQITSAAPADPSSSIVVEITQFDHKKKRRAVSQLAAQ